MRVIKRDGQEVAFDEGKIQNAINKAGGAVLDVSPVVEQCEHLNRAVHVEEIQDMVISFLDKLGLHNIARRYSEYRLMRSLDRKLNTTDGRILSIIERNNEEALEENSNKNPVINSTQRDYIAGEVSRDISRRILLPKDVAKAHDEGILWFHDMDYFVQHMSNCCLVNLEDMLQNGTVISGTLIEKPHSFATACNITTQIIAQVASSQYGGQTVTLSHIAPFIDVSRQSISALFAELFSCSIEEAKEQYREQIAAVLKREISRGVQTIQYQINTLMTSNGQTPFVTLFMYLDEVPEGILRDDLAMLIEEVLRQRLQGVKNEKGAWVSPAFPKLIYVLDEDNITPESKYFYLTELAARCTAKRMVPDYISAKVMKRLKGDIYPCIKEACA